MYHRIEEIPHHYILAITFYAGDQVPAPKVRLRFLCGKCGNLEMRWAVKAAPPRSTPQENRSGIVPSI